MKPSCAVMKLIEAIGLRPVCSYRSDEPATRLANSASVDGSPRQKSRTVSRYLPFHSVHSGREPADLVAAVADVPRLGDELDLGDDRVLLDDVEERRQAVDLVELAGQGRGEVEAEAVDVHVRTQ